jgi:hypothetical protein
MHCENRNVRGRSLLPATRGATVISLVVNDHQSRDVTPLRLAHIALPNDQPSVLNSNITICHPPGKAVAEYFPAC